MAVNLADSTLRGNYEIITCDDELNQARCFPCSKCNECMAGQEVVHQNDRTYCWRCYEALFGLKCVSCSKTVAGFSEMAFIYYNHQVWHAECFYCSSCRISLEGREVKQKGRSIYCKGCCF